MLVYYKRICVIHIFVSTDYCGTSKCTLYNNTHEVFSIYHSFYWWQLYSTGAQRIWKWKMKLGCEQESDWCSLSMHQCFTSQMVVYNFLGFTNSEFWLFYLNSFSNSARGKSTVEAAKSHYAALLAKGQPEDEVLEKMEDWSMSDREYSGQKAERMEKVCWGA